MSRSKAASAYDQTPKLDMSYLDDLKAKREKIDARMKQRQQEQDKSLKLFLNHIQKELEMLITDRQHKQQARTQIDDRNQQFQEEIKRHGEHFRKGLAEVMESSDKLREAKEKYMLYLKQNHRNQY